MASARFPELPDMADPGRMIRISRSTSETIVYLTLSVFASACDWSDAASAHANDGSISLAIV